jgi:HEAT repeat protein
MFGVEEPSDASKDALGLATRAVTDAVNRGAQEEVVVELVLSVGALKDPRSLEFFASLRRSSSPGVRRAVAEAVPLAMIAPDDSALGVGVLLSLFDDEDAVVRDWAVCSLGRTLATDTNGVPAAYDTSRIRAALTARLGDEDPATRAEACAGLALRHVVEVVGPLRLELARPDVGRVPLIAAEAIASPELRESLVALRSWWTRDPELLERAIVACSPRE